jgi:hypothetical protein
MAFGTAYLLELGVRHSFLIALTASIVLLLLFLYVNAKNPAFLRLDAKWLAFACIPIVGYLVIQGQVDDVKALGIEITFSLNRGVVVVLRDRVSTLAIDTSEAEKGERGELPRLAKLHIKRLLIIAGRCNSDNLDDHLRALTDLECIEVVATDRKEFICIVPISVLRNAEGKLDRQQIEHLCAAIKDNAVISQFPSAITQSVAEDTSLLEALSSTALGQ